MAEFHSLMDYATRQKELAAALPSVGVDALLVTHLPNVRYLCGFSGTAGVLVAAGGGRITKCVFYTDGRYAQQAADEVRGVKIVITKKAAFTEACLALSRTRIKVLGFEADHLSYAAYRQLSQNLRGKVRMRAVSGRVEEMRLCKHAGEVEQIRASALVAASLFPTALAAIRPGVSENLVAGEMELQARRAGVEKMSFDTIVAAGARSALPHGRASSQAIPGNGFIILDWGVILAGYCSDMTRTVHVGAVSASRKRMYQAVREAQLASIEAVRPGASTGEVDRAGRELLKKAGYGSYFTHSTGHGVGLEVHEAPRLAKDQTQELMPGMVVTIEPGIYLPDEGGVRIEDMVLVTESGREILTPTTKDLITL
jgi:Xaa-Pro aminopeptidase